MKRELPALITPDTTSGLALAGRPPEQLHEQFAQANDRVVHSGGTNFLLAAPANIEVSSSVLFYTISAANHGWTSAGLGR